MNNLFIQHSGVKRLTAATLLTLLFVLLYFSSQNHASATPPFYLPWVRGETWKCSYDNNASHHDPPLNDYAWDFTWDDADNRIVSVGDGTVLFAVDQFSDEHIFTSPHCGNGIVINHGGNIYSLYCHMQYHSITVEDGDTVSAGHVIGRGGASGYAYGPHLHFSFISSPVNNAGSLSGTSISVGFESVNPVSGSYYAGNAPYPEGMWLHDVETGADYLVSDGKRRWVQDWDSAYALGMTGELSCSMSNVTTSVIESLPWGPDIPRLHTGDLVRNMVTGGVHLISRGVHSFPNMTTLRKLGWEEGVWTNIPDGISRSLTSSCLYRGSIPDLSYVSVVEDALDSSLYFLQNNSTHRIDARRTYWLLGGHPITTLKKGVLSATPPGSLYTSYFQYGEVRGITDDWSFVSFSPSFYIPYQEPPVLVAQIVSEAGGDPAHIRIRDVTTHGFWVRVEEDLNVPTYPAHANGETVHWMALPEHSFAPLFFQSGYGFLEAGKLSCVTDSWQAVSFPQGFSSVPSLMAQMVSANGGDNAHIDISSRTKDGFWVRIEEDDSEDGTHGCEEVHWMALPTGSYGYLHAGRTGQVVTSSWYDASFGDSLSGSGPLLYAQIVTEVGADNAHIDIQAVTSTGFTVRVEEEYADPLPIHHQAESIDWIAIRRP